MVEFHPILNKIIGTVNLTMTLTFSLLLATNICHLLITYANSLDPSHDRQNVGPDLDPKLFNTFILFLIFFEKVYFEKKTPK